MPQFSISKNERGGLDVVPIDLGDRQKPLSEQAEDYRREKALAREDNPSRIIESQQKLDIPKTPEGQGLIDLRLAPVEPCPHCGQVCKTEQGRTSHIRNRHPETL